MKNESGCVATATPLQNSELFKNSLDKHWAENPSNIRVNWLLAFIDTVHNSSVHKQS